MYPSGKMVGSQLGIEGGLMAGVGVESVGNHGVQGE